MSCLAQLKISEFRSRISRVGVLAALSLALLLCVFAPLHGVYSEELPGDRDALTVHFIDIGQGDSALIISPTGKTALLDSGPSKSWGSLKRHLDHFNVKKLDLLINSHPHADHIGNASRVIERYGVKVVLDSGFTHPIRAYRDMLETIQARGVSLKLARRGRKIDIGGGAQIQILGPQEPFISSSRSDPNSNSVIFRLTYKGQSALFTGDAEEETEQRLLIDPKSLRADLLKVAHHGSKHASGASFLRATRPRHAVISCSERNRYGHPAPETLNNLKRAGAEIWVTAETGSVIATTRGTSWELRALSERTARGDQSAQDHSDATETEADIQSGDSTAEATSTSTDVNNGDTSRINVNTAGAHTLTQLPRIGPKLAERIIKARAEAPFTSADDLRTRVRGIGVKTAATLAPLISF